MNSSNKFYYNIVISILTLSTITFTSFLLVACNLPLSNKSTSSSAPHNSTDSSSLTASLESTQAATAEITKSEVVTKSKIIDHAPADFVNIIDYIPDAVIDLRYATSDNFTGCVIYDFTDAYIRYGTLLKLLNVNDQLKQLGYRIKIWDSFRPFEAQIKLWNVYPNGNYVADPKKGYTSHNLGNTVDLTITDMNGNELPMPTAFDDFTLKADRNYGDVSLEQASNSKLLEKIMTECGFKGYSNEWWHYEDTVSYDPDENFLPPGRNE